MSIGAIGERSFLEIDGRRIAYRSWGDPDRPQSTVLLHGWGANADTFAGVAGGLEAEHRLVAIDLPGFGRSDPPPVAWSSADYARLVEQLCAQLGLVPEAFAGHSFGGKIAIHLAINSPALVKKLVLVNSAGIRPKRSLDYKLRVSAYKIGRRVTRGTPLADWMASQFGSADYRGAGPMRATLVRVVNEDVSPMLGRVRAATLIIWGENDQETPIADAAIMEIGIPDAGLVVFPGAGHFAYADDPQRFVRWLGTF